MTGNSIPRHSNEIERIDNDNQRHNVIDHTKGGQNAPVLHGTDSDEQELVSPTNVQDHWQTNTNDYYKNVDNSGVKTKTHRQPRTILLVGPNRQLDSNLYNSNSNHGYGYGSDNVINHQPRDHHSGYDRHQSSGGHYDHRHHHSNEYDSNVNYGHGGHGSHGSHGSHGAHGSHGIGSHINSHAYGGGHQDPHHDAGHHGVGGGHSTIYNNRESTYGRNY